MGSNAARESLVEEYAEDAMPTASSIADADTAPLANPVANPAGSINSPLADAEFQIRLEFFQGPMDLLLHLVARQEVSVEQVSMTVVAEQYLAIVVRAAERIDLERAGEFLVVASTLLAIKSRALLPVEVDEEPEESSEWGEGNPFFEDLRARLLAYQETQQRAELLRKLPQLNVDTFARRDKKLLHPTPEMLQEPEDVFSLGGLFAGLLKRIGASSTFNITAQPFAVVDFMVSIVDSLSQSLRQQQQKTMSFPGLLRVLRKTSLKGSNRTVVIGGFIAVLELMKRGLVTSGVAQQVDSEETNRQELGDDYVTSTDISDFEVSLAFDSFTEDQSIDFSSEFDTAPDSTEEEQAEGAVESSGQVIPMDAFRAPASAETEQEIAEGEHAVLDEVEVKVVGMQSGRRD